MNIKEVINTKEYDFLRTNEHLKDKIIFLTLGGSHAYGTNVEGSDTDIRGCALNSRTDILGLSHFEQVIDNNTDTTVYGFNKFVNLLLNCNPNVIEMLGCKTEHYDIQSHLGKLLIDNANLFLSQRCIKSFGGYAKSQLHALENKQKSNHPKTGKHAMHLLRLYMMGIDILTKEKIITYRVNEIPLLLDVRNGLFQREDGTMMDGFWKIVEDYQKQFDYAVDNTAIRVSPDYKEVEDLVMYINSCSINGLGYV